MTETERPRGPLGRVAVIIPTYNERENLESIVARVRSAVPEADLLVVDDNSPDGTGELADKLAAGDEQIHVLHRPGKAGLGAAYIAGFGWALERGYGVMVEMDADGSHQPAGPAAAADARCSDADLVIGSRWVPGGTVRNWPKSREILSRGANTYARLMLRRAGPRRHRRVPRLPGAARCARSAWTSVQSQGYCFQIDLTLRAVNAGLTVTEVPITFVERTRGASKMSRAIMAEAFWRVAQWGIADRLRHRRRAAGQPGRSGRSRAASPAAQAARKKRGR